MKDRPQELLSYEELPDDIRLATNGAFADEMFFWQEEDGTWCVWCVWSTRSNGSMLRRDYWDGFTKRWRSVLHPFEFVPDFIADLVSCNRPPT